MDSDIDKRTKIYFPIVQTGKNINLFTNDKMNNLSQMPRLQLTNSTLFPDKQYVMSQIEEVIGYYSMTGTVQVLDDLGEEITLEQLVDVYYSDPESCFFTREGQGMNEEYPNKATNENDS
jgi:hypothetical protein